MTAIRNGVREVVCGPGVGTPPTVGPRALRRGTGNAANKCRQMQRNGGADRR